MADMHEPADSPCLESLSSHQITWMVRRGELISLTTRTFEEQLRELRLTREHLQGKKLLAVGAGLSDFVSEANRVPGCRCVGVDPLYRLVANSETLEEFVKFLPAARTVLVNDRDRQNLTECYHCLKTELLHNRDSYDSGSFQSLERGETFDLIVACHVTEYLTPADLREGVLRARNLLSDEGQITLAPFNTFLPDSSRFFVTLKREYPVVGEYLNPRDDGQLLDVLKENASAGMHIYAGLGATKPKVYIGDPMEDEVVSHTVLMMRKGERAPSYSPPAYAQDGYFRDINVLQLHPEATMSAGRLLGFAAEPASYV